MKGIFPAWRAAFKTQTEVANAKYQWTKAFVENGVCDWEYIEGGLSEARLSDSDFMPSTGHFLKWCKKHAMSGLPSLDDAYTEAVRHIGRLEHDWSHRAVFHAAVQCGRDYLRGKAEEKSRPRFKNCYEKACEDFISGVELHQLPVKPKALPAQVELTKEEKQAQLAKLRATVDL